MKVSPSHRQNHSRRGASINNYRPPATFPRDSIRNNANAPTRTQDVIPENRRSAMPTPSQSSDADEDNSGEEGGYYLDGGSDPLKPVGLREAIPFCVRADINGLDGSKEELSISLLLKVESTRSDMFGRNSCRVIAERFEARLAKLTNTHQTTLELQEVQLRMGPSMSGFHGSDYDLEKYKRSFRAEVYEPQLRDLVVKDYRVDREVGGAFRLGYPVGISVEANGKKRRGITLPASSAGLDPKMSTVEYINRNQVQWRYGISSDAEILPPLLNRTARFANHHADFSYDLNMIPPSMVIEVTVICSVPPPSLSQRLRFIRYKGKNYPCRDIRLKLRINVLPTAKNLFLFPRLDCKGKYLDLGSYEFMNKDGHLCLNIDRNGTSLTLSDAQLFGNEGYDVKTNNWSVRKAGLNELDVRETCNDRVICPTSGGLSFKLK
jgi:hypothetical protein